MRGDAAVNILSLLTEAQTGMPGRVLSGGVPEGGFPHVAESALWLLQAASCSVREGSPVLALAHVAVNAGSHYAEVRPAVLC